MKKILLSAAILVAACVSVKAQVSLGIKGGVNFSKINTDNLNSSTRTGYQAGIFTRFGSNLYLQPELYLSSTGGEFHSGSNNNDVSASGNVKFTNLNIPVLVGHSFGEKNLNFRIMAGPVYTSVLSKSFSQSLADASADFGHYKSSTLGFQAGAGVDIGAITADIRYEGGLTKINSDFGQRQNLWALSVGFKIF